jgi:hypothetical protein
VESHTKERNEYTEIKTNFDKIQVFRFGHNQFFFPTGQREKLLKGQKQGNAARRTR